MAGELPEHGPVTAPHTKLNVRVVPNASKAEVVGWLEEAVLKVKVMAPPEGGRANREVIALIARATGIARREVTIVSGEKSRNKVIAVQGMDADQLRGCLSGFTHGN